jgi:hypothetical protein
MTPTCPSDLAASQRSITIFVEIRVETIEGKVTGNLLARAVKLSNSRLSDMKNLVERKPQVATFETKVQTKLPSTAFVETSTSGRELSLSSTPINTPVAADRLLIGVASSTLTGSTEFNVKVQVKSE